MFVGFYKGYRTDFIFSVKIISSEVVICLSKHFEDFSKNKKIVKITLKIVLM